MHKAYTLKTTNTMEIKESLNKEKYATSMDWKT